MCYWVVPLVFVLSWGVLPPLSSFTGVRTAAVFTHRVLCTSSLDILSRVIVEPVVPRARVDLTIVHVVRRHVLTGIRRHLTGIRGRVGPAIIGLGAGVCRRAAPLARPKVAVSKRVVSFSYSSDTPVKPGRKCASRGECAGSDSLWFKTPQTIAVSLYNPET